MLAKTVSLLGILILFIHPGYGQSDLKSLKEKYRLSNTSGERIHLLIQISKAFYGTSEDSAKWYSKRAVEMAKSNGLDSSYHLAQVQNAIVFIDSEDSVDVKGDLLEAIKFQEKNSLLKHLTVSYNALGNYYFTKQKLEEALSAYQKSIDYEEKSGNRMGLALSKFNLGFLLQRMDRYEEAYQNMSFGYRVILHAKDTGRWIRSSISLGDLFSHGNAQTNAIYNLDSAIFYANQGFQLAKSVDFDYAEMRALGTLMIALADRGDCTQALAKLEELRENYGHLFTSEYINLNQLKEAQALVCIGQADKSIELLKSLLTKGYSVEKVNYLLAEAYRIKGEYKTSVSYLQAYLTLHDSTLYNTNQIKLAELQTKYETEKKDSEIATLSQQAQIQALQISQRNTQLIGAGVLLLVLILVGFAFNQQRKFKHQQAVTDMEQRMLRLQINPHFIFNALASIQNYILQSDTKESVSYLAKFGKLMRQILEHSREEFIPIREEADMLRNYLEIQQLRFKNRFDFNIEIDPSINPDDMRIPPLFAQPFVENAIEHGLKDKVSDGLITIRFLPEGKNIRLEVKDNGSGITTSMGAQKEHKSLATVITRERLAVFEKKLKQNFALQFQSEKNGTLAVVYLPSTTTSSI